jgi:molybdate transport system substrate-binding protein
MRFVTLQTLRPSQRCCKEPLMLKALLAAVLLLLAFALRAESLTIAAASDLKFALDEIVERYRVEHPTAQIAVVYGSSGKFHTQIQQGAPYDLYFSADIEFPRALSKAGFAASPLRGYAMGRIVLWSARLDASQMTMASLTDPQIRRIAIANPQHAPYGKRAVEALKAAGIWAQVESKLVYGDNIAHATQFVETGNAQVGITALSLALNPNLAAAGGYWLIPETLHQPLEQAFIITKRAADNALAHDFANYLSGGAARAVMTRYGFALPDAGH